MKRIISLILVVLLTFSLCGCSSENPETYQEKTDWESIISSNKLKIGVFDGGYTEEDENGKFSGFNIDLIEAICNDLTLNYELIEIDPQNFEKQLKEKIVDCVWGLIYSNTYEEKFDCSIPYILTDEIILFTAENSVNYPDTNSLKGIKNITAVKDSLALATASDFGISCEAVADERTAADKVLSGAFNGCVMDYYKAAKLLKQEDYSKLVIGPSLASYNNVIVYNKGSDLNKSIRNAIKKLTENTTIDTIAENYGLYYLLPNNKAN